VLEIAQAAGEVRSALVGWALIDHDRGERTRQQFADPVRFKVPNEPYSLSSL